VPNFTYSSIASGVQGSPYTTKFAVCCNTEERERRRRAIFKVINQGIIQVIFYNRFHSSKEREEEQEEKGYQSGCHPGYR
jgi:hypothetical protein